jgi:hypothetical protein
VTLERPNTVSGLIEKHRVIAGQIDATRPGRRPRGRGAHDQAKGIGDYFVRRTGRRPWLETYDADAVLPFEGEVAEFQVEKLPGKPPRFIRQV